ncbi:hypothetical protein CsSME_00050475 [Camellia sinensis var. sinensis]
MTADHLSSPWPETQTRALYSYVPPFVSRSLIPLPHPEPSPSPETQTHTFFDSVRGEKEEGIVVPPRRRQRQRPTPPSPTRSFEIHERSIQKQHSRKN